LPHLPSLIAGQTLDLALDPELRISAHRGRRFSLMVDGISA
jgi:hypothetical protein